MPAALLRLLPLLVLLAALSASCADITYIWFENKRGEPVTVSVDGDRLLVLRPGVAEGLPYSSAAWAWPRRIDVATWREGAHLWSARFDADDLARHRFVIPIY